MPCYHPLHGFYSRALRKMFFGTIPHDIIAQYHDSFEEMAVPCGKCIGCRLEYSRKWAIRCVHEALLYVDNCFITLTYDEANLPANNSLCKRDFQLFMKRLRKSFPFDDIRFFAAGEYGDNTARPHYHAILFNFTPPDYKPGRNLLQLDPLSNDVDWSTLWNSSSTLDVLSSSSSTPLPSSAAYSARLASIWKKGLVFCGNVTFESCAYVARYCLKKINGKDAEEHYKGREKEFVLMSRRPGIGAAWLDKFGPETLANDAVICRGHFCKPPRYYDNLLEEFDKEKMLENKEKRRKFAKIKEKELTQERLYAMEEIVESRQKRNEKKL